MFIDKPFQTAPALGRRIFKFLAVLSCAGAVAACGGSGSPGTDGSLPSDPVASSLAVYKAALENGQTYWDTLPHTDIAGDLAAVASEMKSSGIATQTYVSANAITATLTDGQSFLLVYDDRDVTSPMPVPPTSGSKPAVSTAGRQRVASASAQGPGFFGPGTQHEIAFFVNSDDPLAFQIQNQEAFSKAFSQAGFPASAYQVDFQSLSLNILADLGDSHPIDFLNIATHGGASCRPDGTQCQYRWMSQQHPDLDSWTTFYKEIQQGTMGGGGVLKLMTVHDAETYSFRGEGAYWFTPEFLTAHLKFNPGAVVVNSSCYGQDPKIAAAVAATLAKAGVGLYTGWTGQARGWDADQSDAYLLDRLLGELVDTGLGTLTWEGSTQPLIKQRTPAQRPFPLDDVLVAMNTIERLPHPGSPENDMPGIHTLTQATNNAASTLTFTKLNGGGSNSNLVIWGLPSIATMTTVETPTGATLVVNGTFPSTSGKGQIVDASGTYLLTPSAWSKAQIQFSLPPGGNGAAGLVTVFSDEGVASNPVPLTEWKGQLVVTVNDSATAMSDTQGRELAGIGSGSIVTTTSLDFRADVHPVVTQIDTTPQPQNFVFAGVMGDSRTSLTFADARFRSSDGLNSAQWSLAQPITTQTPVYAAPVSSGTFLVSPYTGADHDVGCNSGLSGPQTSGPTNVFCPFGGINVANALTCSDSDGTLCVAPTYGYTGYYGYPPSVAEGSFVRGYDGLLVFTLNPTTYEVTFTSNPASLVEDYLFNASETITITLAATIQPPLNAPKAAAPGAIASARQ